MPFTIIAANCISCGVCEPACPNGGIRKDEKRSSYVIDANSCTECVGFFNKAQCVVVCPMDCCVLDPSNTLTEAVLFERAMATHYDSDKRPTLTAQTSHFRVPVPTKWWERLFRSARNEAPVNDENVTQRDASLTAATLSN